MVMQIEEPRHYRIGLHHLGFRPFFLLGGLFAISVVAVWLWILSYQGSIPGDSLGIVQWHAHEMIFGYTLAVIAGFLLTAVGNWTGIKTLYGTALMLLALCWLIARLMPFIPYSQSVLLMAVFDLIFNVGLCLALLYPIVKARQWKQLALWFKVLLIMFANMVFYLEVFNQFENGRHLGLYLALYIVVSLIMMMGRRVIPFFIEKGVYYSVSLKNYQWLDLASLVLMLIFITVEVFLAKPLLAAVAATALAVIHSWRLVGWYTHGIWYKPLLWILYLGYAWLIAGFILKALSYWSEINPMLAIHAFAYGGIGMMTLGMMSRVTLGHTGRDVFKPPQILPVLFILLLMGSVARVIMPIVFEANYALWITFAQWFWIVTFTGFVLIYAPMLVKGRIDGKYG